LVKSSIFEGEQRMGKLAGRVAIVTGSSKGIGAGIAKHLGRAGAAVVVNYLSSKEGADRVVNQIINEGGTAIAAHADVTKQADIERLFLEAKNAYGRLDIVVNNAGIYEFRSIENVTVESYYKQFDVNVLGLILCCKEAVKYFDTARNGNIINIASTVSTVPPARLSLYSATKAAVDAVTKSLSKELGPRNIRVNSISPGLIETEGTHASGLIGSDFHMQVVAQTPLGRIGQPDDIARVAVFLASDDSAWVTGESLRVSGGSS
jgi:3-oxoacyl-[acyl-carrier protein] reductase